jgi:hypothetical protein
MVLREALPERSGFLDDIVLIATSRPCQRGLEGAAIPDTE